MAKYILVAMNGPTPGEGHEDIYNQWYNDVHVPDLLKVPGINAAKRYRVVGGNISLPYVALYEIESDNIDETLKAIEGTISPFHETFDRSVSRSIVAVALDD